MALLMAGMVLKLLRHYIVGSECNFDGFANASIGIGRT